MFISDWLSGLASSSVFVVFTIIALGYALGRVTIKGIEIGTAGVLVVALIFGHFSSSLGFNIPSFVTTFGTVLFVTAVGFIAGPNFFRNLKMNAKSYVLLGFVIVLVGAAACIAVIKLMDIPKPLAVGMLTGALTSTPGLSAANEAAAAISEEAVQIVSVGYGIAYPFGVLGVVLFVQLLPKLLHVNMEEERRLISHTGEKSRKKKEKKLLVFENLGLFAFALAASLGIMLGNISIPLPGGMNFSLGTTGGPLIAALVIAHFGNIGPVDMHVEKKALTLLREFGLSLFLVGAGFNGGNGFVDIVKEYGAMLFVYGALMTIIPMVVGYFVARYLLKLSLLNNLGSICGGMTSTPALGTLIRVSGSNDAASAYAATYPVALVTVVLCAQLIAILL